MELDCASRPTATHSPEPPMNILAFLQRTARAVLLPLQLDRPECLTHFGPPDATTCARAGVTTFQLRCELQTDALVVEMIGLPAPNVLGLLLGTLAPLTPPVRATYFVRREQGWSLTPLDPLAARRRHLQARLAVSGSTARLEVVADVADWACEDVVVAELLGHAVAVELTELLKDGRRRGCVLLPAPPADGDALLLHLRSPEVRDHLPTGPVARPLRLEQVSPVVAWLAECDRALVRCRIPLNEQALVAAALTQGAAWFVELDGAAG